MNTADIQTSGDDNSTLYRVKFSLLLTLHIPAIILSLLIFGFFIKHRAMLRTPQHQALLILLIVNFLQLTVDLSNSLHFYRLGYISPSMPAYCTWWNFFNFTLSVTGEYLMATISIQRHVLVFNGHLLRVRRLRLLIHNLPLLFCLIYPMIFYIFAAILYPCDGTQWDYTKNGCGFADCYLIYDKVLGTFDWSVNNGLPMVTNTFANVILIIQVVRQKRRNQQRLEWRKQRRMTLRLFYISSLYLIAWTPSLTVGLAQALGYPIFLAEIQSNYFIPLIFIVCLFLPWICFGLLSELKKWIAKLYTPWQANNIVGTT